MLNQAHHPDDWAARLREKHARKTASKHFAKNEFGGVV